MKKNSPLVSVIFPVYNKQTTLPQSIQSVFDQTYENFEVIAVDDNSEDYSQQVLSLIEEPRLVKHYLSSTGGVVNAYREGIKKAKGEYIMFHDSDDLSLPDRIEKCMDAIGDNDVVYHGLYLVAKHPDYPVTGKKYAPAEHYSPTRIYTEQYIPGVIFARKSILEKIDFPEEAQYAWDWMHHILLHEAGAKYVALNEGLYEYWRFINNSLSHHNERSGNRQESIKFIQDYLIKQGHVKKGHKFGKGFKGFIGGEKEMSNQ